MIIYASSLRLTTTRFSSQATVCVVLVLGSEAVPYNSVQVTTFSAPVPSFGGTSVVQGVLTPASHTASEGW